jgi:hypothetical protein
MFNDYHYDKNQNPSQLDFTQNHYSSNTNLSKNID